MDLKEILSKREKDTANGLFVFLVQSRVRRLYVSEGK